MEDSIQLHEARVESSTSKQSRPANCMSFYTCKRIDLLSIVDIDVAECNQKKKKLMRAA